MSRFKSKQHYLRGYGGASGHAPLYIYQSELYHRRGAGIGSIFSNIYSSVIPFLKGAFKVGSKVAKSSAGRTIAKNVKKKAMRAGLNVVGDALQGKNVVQSTKREVKKAQSALKKDIVKRASAAANAAALAAIQPNRSTSLKRKKTVTATPAGLAKRANKNKDIFDT